MAVRVTSEHGLAWNATIDDSELDRIAAKIEKRIESMSQSVQQEGDKMSSLFKNLAAGAAAFFTAKKGAELIDSIVRVRGEVQQLEIAFGTMLQSKERANVLIGQMVDLAARTPFGLQDVATGAKQLLAYGFAAEEITKNIITLGNVASGVGSQLSDLIYLYGTLKASGRVTQIDINQFANRGIPIYTELSKVLGTTVEKVRELVSAGQVNFSDIEKAFQNMTSQGGLFFNLMEEQSKSLVGQISNLQDSVAQMFNEIGQSKESWLSDGIAGVAYLVEHYKEIGRILAVLITTYGSYRAALILTNVAHATAIAGSRALAVAETAAAVAGTRVTAVQVLQAGAINILAAAQAKLNAVMSANPYVAIVTAVSALASAMYFLRDITTAAEKAQERFNNRNEETKKIIDDLKNSAQEYINIINSDTSTSFAQLDAFQKLQQLYPGRLNNLTIEEFKLKTIAEQQKLINSIADDFSLNDAIEQLEEANKRVSDLKDSIKEAEFKGATQSAYYFRKELEVAEKEAELAAEKVDRLREIARLAAMTEQEKIQYYTKQKEELEKIISKFETFNGELFRAEDGTIHIKDNLAAWSILNTINQFNTLIGQINKIKGSLGPDGKPFRTLAQIDQEIQDIEDKMKNAPKQTIFLPNMVEGYDSLKKRLEALKKERDEFTGDNKIGTDATNLGRLEKEQERTAKSRAKFLTDLALEEEKYTDKLTYESAKQITEVREKYEKMRQAAIDKGFSRTRHSGVFQRIDNLEKKEIGTLQYEKETEQLLKHLDRLKQIYADYEAYKTEVGKEEADKRFKNEYKDFNPDTSYLDLLRKEAAALNAKAALGALTGINALTSAERERQLELNQRIADSQKEQFDKENALRAKALVDLASYQEKRTSIIRRYNDLIRTLGDNATEEQKEEAAKQMRLELQQLDEQRAQEISKASSFFEGLILQSKEAVKNQINVVRDILKSSVLPYETRKQLENDLKNLNNLLRINDEDLVITQLNTELADVNKRIEEIEKGAPAAAGELQKLYDRKTQIGLQLTDANLKKISEKINSISQLGNAIARLGETLSSLGDEAGKLANVASALQGLGNSLGDIVKLVEGFKNGAFSKGGSGRNSGLSGWVAVIEAAITMIEGVISASAQRKAKQLEFDMAIISQQHAYNLALQEELRLRYKLKDSVFWNSYSDRVKFGIEAEIKAINDYNEAVKGLGNQLVKVGTVKKNDWKKILSNTATGAIAGGQVGGWVGAIVGGVVGFFSGLFSKKKVDVYGGLLQAYPDLIDKEGKLNRERAKALLQSGLLTEQAKQQLQYVESLADAYEAAKEQIEQVVSELAGGLANDIINSLVDSYKKGGRDAGEAFLNGFKPTLAKIAQQLLFEALFAESLKDLQDEIKQSFQTSGIDSIAGIIAEWGVSNKNTAQAYIEGLKAFNDIFDQLGYKDVFGKNSASGNSVSGTIQQITQQQADVLTGQFYAQTTVLNDINSKLPKNYFTDSIVMLNQQFDVLNKIEINTKDTVRRLDKAVASLESIDKKMNNAANQAAAAGYKI